jgi:hypothetical protein
MADAHYQVWGEFSKVPREGADERILEILLFKTGRLIDTKDHFLHFFKMTILKNGIIKRS